MVLDIIALWIFPSRLLVNHLYLSQCITNITSCSQSPDCTRSWQSPHCKLSIVQVLGLKAIILALAPIHCRLYPICRSLIINILCALALYEKNHGVWYIWLLLPFFLDSDGSITWNIGWNNLKGVSFSLGRTRNFGSNWREVLGFDFYL